MTTIPILVMLHFSKEFVLKTNASGLGLGAILMQEGRLIAYISKALSVRNQCKSVYKRELVAIMMAF